MIRIAYSRGIAPSLALLALAATALPARAQLLEPVAQRVVQAWQKHDATALSRLAASKGMSIEVVAGQSVGPLPAAQAAAVLRRLFGDRETASVRSATVREVGGEPRQAFLQLAWTSRARGTSENQTSTVFIALVVENAEWRITEIRHIP